MFKGFLCCVEEKPVETDACLACALAGTRPDCPFTYPVLKGIAESNAPRGYVGWSATTILGCARAARLKERVDYYVEPEEAFWAFRGHLAHSLVERTARSIPAAIVETRFAATVIVHGEAILVSGQPDLVYPERGHLVDYKTTKKPPTGYYIYTCRDCGQVMQEGQWKLRRGYSKTCPHCGSVHEGAEVRQALTVKPPRPYESHVGQLSIYRWLLAQHGLEVATAEVVYFNMELLQRVTVDLWSLRDTEQFVHLQLEDLVKPLPPVDRSWRCRNCVVKGACDAAPPEGGTLPEGLILLEEKPEELFVVL